VVLASDEPAIIYYTTDGSEPTTSSSVYSAPITISENTALKFCGVDSSGNPSRVMTETYIITTMSLPITHMSDTTATYGLATNSGRPSHVEFVSPTSQLVGKSIDQITVKLSKTGTPTGNVEVGVFNPDLSVKKLFGTLSATDITSTYTDYTLSLSDSELYTIEAGDRIGIKFADGDSNNFVAIMTDQDASDPFDGANTYYQTYTTSWLSSTAKDLYMILTQTHGGTADTIPPTVTAIPPGGTYFSEQSVVLASDEPATTIYYTTDGSEPTTNSAVYNAPIVISDTMTLKFFGVDAAGNVGSI